jgi:hypothetical protein
MTTTSTVLVFAPCPEPTASRANRIILGDPRPHEAPRS